MAKEETAKTEKKKPTPPKVEKPDYGLDALADELGEKNRAALRARLRNADGLQKQYRKGRVWDFGNKSTVKAVAKQLGEKRGASKKEEAKASKKSKKSDE